MATVADIAAWMMAEVTQQGELYQRDAVDEIERRFGPSFIVENRHGNPAILPAVLDEFRKLTEGTVVWEKNYKYWRLRTQDDAPGKRQVGY